MLDLLENINRQALFEAIGSEKISNLKSLAEIDLVEDDFDSLKLSKYMLAIYGYDLLYEPKIRRLIFEKIEKRRLIDLADKFAKKKYEKKQDNALILSLIPWKSGSKFVIEVAKELKIPKEYLPLKSNYNQATEIIEPIDKLFSLHNYQEELKSKINYELMNETKRFLVQLPTGAGKTRTIIESIFDITTKKNIFLKQESIVWIAHTEELCEQAIDTFKDVWQNLANYPIQIVRCWGSYNQNPFDVIGSFVVGTFQKFNSLLKKKSDIIQTLREASTIIVVDEAHKAIAPTYAKVINYLCSKKASLIGLTATPGRGSEKREENIALSKFFNKKLLSPEFKNDPISELRKQKVLAILNRKIINTLIDVELKEKELENLDQLFDLPKSIIQKLANNTQRNKIILNAIYNELNKKNPCLVFSCSTEHSKVLSSILNYKGFSSTYIDCNIRKGSRKRIIDGFRNGEIEVLFNYGVLSTGFDAPRIRSVIITRPTSSIVLYSQMIGRGLRGPRMGGAEVCNLIDIKDNYLNFGGVEKVYSFFEEYWE